MCLNQQHAKAEHILVIHLFYMRQKINEKIEKGQSWWKNISFGWLSKTHFLLQWKFEVTKTAYKFHKYEERMHSRKSLRTSKLPAWNSFNKMPRAFKLCTKNLMKMKHLYNKQNSEKYVRPLGLRPTTPFWLGLPPPTPPVPVYLPWSITCCIWPDVKMRLMCEPNFFKWAWQFNRCVDHNSKPHCSKRRIGLNFGIQYSL